MLIIAVV